MREENPEVQLLVTGDIHYALRQYDWLLEAAPDFDAVVIAGDLLEVASAVAPDAQIVVIFGRSRRAPG